MNLPNQMLESGSPPENWASLLEVASREVFEIMLGCKLELLPEASANSCEFTAMVGLAGQICGVLAMRCTAESAALMTSRMLGTEVKEADQQMWDAIGEIANMVAGNFKNKLTGMADRCMLSVPTVITGGDYTFHSLADAGSVETHFLFEGAPVIISLELHS